MTDPMEYSNNTKKIRQKDIAAKAGVSPSTVSLLLKDPNTTRVSADTRDRIFEIIRTNRYSGGARHSQGDIVCACSIRKLIHGENGCK